MNEQEQEAYRKSTREWFIKRENAEIQKREEIEKRIFREEREAHLERLKELGITTNL